MHTVSAAISRLCVRRRARRRCTLVDDPSDTIGRQIAAALSTDPGYLLRRRVRTAYTWEAIYRRDIVPLLAGA